jgi:hypothetical protein
LSKSEAKGTTTINEVLAQPIGGNVGELQVGRSRGNAHNGAYSRPIRCHIC